MQQHALELLQKHWGYTAFRPIQEEVIASVLNSEDTLAILPTGGGKSICFQVPALLKEGVCLVISPLIALMYDQVEQLKRRGIKAECLAGHMSFHELERILNNGIHQAYKFLYISPERLSSSLLQEKIKQMKIALVAIDEAHCISHWGKDFRPAYLDCKRLRTWFPDVPIIALTASATPDVQKDIIENLQLNKHRIIKDTLVRNNLAYFVEKTSNKMAMLQRILTKNNESAIIYVRTRRSAQELALQLMAFGFSASYFHGGLPAEEKSRNMSQWLLNDARIMVATNAFGMGIDKPDVRCVIHWDLPVSLEDYFQEAGRAGRDGKKAFAIVLFNDADVKRLQENTNETLISEEILREVYRKLCNHFFIAFDEGEGARHLLNISDFCEKNKFDVPKVFHCLEFLDRNSIISLQQNFRRKTQVKIIASPEKVREHIRKNALGKLLLLYLIRNSGTIYTTPSEIELEKTASVIQKTIQELIFELNFLQKQGLIEYEMRSSDLEIIFLVARGDNQTINTIKKNLKWFNEHKREQCEAILNYISDEKQCKSKHLVHYFGEKNENNCHICSFCIKNKKFSLSTEEVWEKLEENPISFNDLFAKFDIPETKVLEILEKLLEKGKIRINDCNLIEKT